MSRPFINARRLTEELLVLAFERGQTALELVLAPHENLILLRDLLRAFRLLAYKDVAILKLSPEERDVVL